MKKNVPGAINKIQWANEIRRDKPKFEVTIRRDGKTVYYNKAHAGVVNLVQSIDKVDVKEGSIEGDSQVFGFGNPSIQLFALDQLRKKLVPSLMKAVRKVVFC